jgi:hypothetical protein
MEVRLIQIVPPGEGGVIDYARCLQAEWQRLGRGSQVLALSKASANECPLMQRVQALEPGLGGSTAQRYAIVLHFSGYGYGHRGLCGWLNDELQAFQSQAGDGVRLIVVFHELFVACGPPWRSAFWLSRFQARIAARLAGLADAVWTNTEEHAAWLRGIVHTSTPVQVQPVFSNVGEPDALTPSATRAPRAVVFGASSTRQRAFDGLRPFESALQHMGVEELVEVGDGHPSATGLTAIPCRHLGRLELSAMGALLQSSRFGVLDYTSQLLGKSGVFAAYAAHGCVVLDTRTPGQDADGLIAGVHYINLHRANNAAAEPSVATCQERLATELARWYAEHRLSDQAQILWTIATDQVI